MIYQDQFSWETLQPRDPYLHLSIRRSTLNAFIGSLIVHLLVLFVVPQQRVGSGEPSATKSDSLVVNLSQRMMPPREAQAASAPVPAPRPQPPAAHRQHSVVATARSQSRAADRAKLPNPVTPPLPTPAASELLADMQAYVNAARARRRAAEGFSGSESADGARAREPSEDDIRMAIVKRNLHPGTNGVFQILSMESRRAAFSFRGWTNDSSNVQREYIQVEIGTNSTIEIAIVRRMIELIRKYYEGDFNWESERLDRIVTLSARREDNEGLEEFLLKEFFGTRSRITRVR